MNISKLYIGQSFKNYKSMCTELEMEVKTNTNSKNSQMKDLSRYCNYSKTGHVIKINEVYTIPKEKIDNRGGVSIYRDLVQLLITDLLAQCKDGNISISRTKLMNAIGMTNRNYGECRELIPNLASYSEMDNMFVYDFYNTSSSSFRSIIETALNNLTDKSILTYSKVTKISEINKFGTRIAEKEELKLIMDAQKEIMIELGYSLLSEVRVSSDWKKFRLKVLKTLREKSSIDFYFSAYDITINEKYIVNERNELASLLLEKVKRKESNSQLNKLVFDNVVENAKIRHGKDVSVNSRMQKTRKDDMYIYNIEQLSKLLIDENCKGIANILKESDKDRLLIESLDFDELFN